MVDMKDTLDHVVEQVSAINDPLSRCRATHHLITQFDEVTRTLAAQRRKDINTLHDQGVTDTALAAQLGVSDRRIGQIRASKVTTGPERALFAPKADQDVPILVTEKHETERHRPAVMLSTHNMLIKLQAHLAAYGLESTSEAVPGGADVNLNRDNLIIMMGPRSRPLIRQAITADPVVEWHLDPHDQGYLYDTTTGKEYRSDYDTIRPHPAKPPTTCYAHIGRITSPNQRTSFLLIGGLHGPGTAGAVEYLIHNADTIYNQVRRNTWSAIVRVTADHAGNCLGAELVTTIHKHGGSR